MTRTLPTVNEIAKSIDHALLKPDQTRAELDAGLALAAKYDLLSVCVRPSDITQAIKGLLGTRVKIGTVVGFPHGSSTTATKVFETADAAEKGAQEIDFVLNISDLKSGFNGKVLNEMISIVDIAARSDVEIVKVIFETAYLTAAEIKTAATLAEDAGVDFIKTSTGFAGEGATLPNLQLMRSSVSKQIQVKASGGVRDLDTLLAMRDLGVTRFGTSASPVILDDLAGRLNGDAASSTVHTEAY